MITQRTSMHTYQHTAGRIRCAGETSASAFCLSFHPLTSDFPFRLHRTPSTPRVLVAQMAPPLAPAAPEPHAPAKPALGQFRLGDEHNSDASDTDQSDTSGRALSPSRKGLTKSGKRKERRQFGAFAEELGDLLGAAFQQPVDESSATSLGRATP
jgi:hypothetical protein